MREWATPRRVVLLVIGCLVALFLLAPVIVNIPIGLTSENSLSWPPRGYSFRWFENIIDDPGWSSSLVLSVIVAAGTACLSIAVGVPTALGLVRGRFPGQRIVAGLMMAPLLVPTIIIAIGMYFVWTLGWQVGPFAIGGDLIGTIPGYILAHTAIASPYVVILVGVSLGNFDRELELAARGLGASPWRAFRRITVPLILPAIVGGGLLAFLTSWDEPLIALFLAQPGQETLPVRMFTAAKEAVDPTVAAVSTVVSATTVVVLGVLTLLRRRR